MLPETFLLRIYLCCFLSVLNLKDSVVAVVAGWELFSVGDNLLEDTMLFGAFTMLSKFTTLIMFYLDFLVICIMGPELLFIYLFCC